MCRIGEKMNILNVIPYGRENAISRAEIVRLTGIPDRDMRDYIKQLNTELVKHGEAILSSSGCRGYWRTSSIEEMKAYIAEAKHRQNQIMKNAAPILSLIYKKEGVTVVPVRSHFRHIKSNSVSKSDLSLF